MALKFTNLERYLKKLERIPESIRKRAQADLMLAGREINILQRSLVPVDKGTLRSTIRTEPMTAPRIGALIKAGGKATTKPIRKSKKCGVPTYDYALAQDLGTVDMPANPFFGVSVRAKKASVKRRLRAGIKAAIKAA